MTEQNSIEEGIEALNSAIDLHQLLSPDQSESVISIIQTVTKDPNFSALATLLFFDKLSKTGAIDWVDYKALPTSAKSEILAQLQQRDQASKRRLGKALVLAFEMIFKLGFKLLT
jgi:hypothetical protein